MQSEDDDPVTINVWRPVETVLDAAPRVSPGPRFRPSTAGSNPATFQPKWAPAPLLKSHERSKPPLGWPRTTDSLCPTCVKEARQRILSGEQSIETLVNEHVGEIKAHIIERDGQRHRREDLPACTARSPTRWRSTPTS